MSLGKWTVAHPAVLVLIAVLGMVSGRVVSNPDLDPITKIILVFFSLTPTLLAILFECIRSETKP